MAPEYSVLNPETSSDSASLKSKGARWVSAKVQTIQMGIKKIKTKEENEDRLLTEKEEIKKRSTTKRVVKTDS